MKKLIVYEHSLSRAMQPTAVGVMSRSTGAAFFAKTNQPMNDLFQYERPTFGADPDENQDNRRLSELASPETFPAPSGKVAPLPDELPE
jgi:hypothetical protein